MKDRPNSRTILLIAILFAASLFYFAILAPSKFGVQYDDAIYVTTAKAMATGEGYRIISLPYEPAQTKYPPFYPFLLSLVWRVFPQFPQNLIPMMLLSVVMTLGFLALTYRYLVKYEYASWWQALIVVGLAAVNMRTMLLATTISSETTYAALSVAALYLAEKYDAKKQGWIIGVIVGVMIGLAFLTRNSGLALLVAMGTYYVMRREWRRALAPVVVGSMFVVGWTVWSYVNKTAVEGVNVAYYTNYWRDYNEIVSNLQAVSHDSKLVILLGIIAKNVLGYILVSISICSGIAYEWMQYFGFAFLLLVAGFRRQILKRFRLLHVYVIAYLALILPWPYINYSRFLIPLLPFLLLFLVVEINALISVVRKEIVAGNQFGKRISAAFICLILLLTVSITLYSYGSELYRSLASSSLKKSNGSTAEDTEAIKWVNAHTNLSDVIICSRDPLYFLYTGRKATRSFQVNVSEVVSFQSQQQAEDEESKQLLQIINENNGRYLIFTASDSGYKSESNEMDSKIFFKQYWHNLTPVFESEDGNSKIYRIENPVAKYQ